MGRDEIRDRISQKATNARIRDIFRPKKSNYRRQYEQHREPDKNAGDAHYFGQRFKFDSGMNPDEPHSEPDNSDNQDNS